MTETNRGQEQPSVRAVVYDPARSPTMRIHRLPQRAVDPEEIRIDVRAVPISEYWLQRSAAPMVPSWVVAGTVTEIGSRVTRPMLGQRVAAMHRLGGLAESVVVPALAATPLPDDLPFEYAVSLPAGVKAALVVDTVTEHLATRATPGTGGRVRATRVLVIHDGTHFASIAAGLLTQHPAVQIIGASSPPSTVEHQCSIGYDEALDLTTDSVEERVFRLTDGCGVDAVIDHLGFVDAGTIGRVVRPLGCVVRCDRERSPLRAASAAEHGRLRDLGIEIVDFPGVEAAARTIDELPQRVARVIRAITDGAVILPTTTVPFDEFERVPELLAGGTVAGAIVVTR